MTARCYFEDAAPLAFADQGVAGPQTLRPTDVRAEEGIARLASIFPHRLARSRVKLNDARKWIGGNVAAVCKQGDISVRQQFAVVLHPPAIVAVLPLHAASLPIDDAYHIEPAKADQDIAVGKRRDRVGMRELIAALARTERIVRDIHVAGGMPFPHYASVRAVDFINEIAIHAAIRVRSAGKTTGYASFNLGRDDLPAKKYCVAVRQATKVMMLADVAMLPDHIPIPGIFP